MPFRLTVHDNIVGPDPTVGGKNDRTVARPFGVRTRFGDGDFSIHSVTSENDIQCDITEA